MEENPIRKIKRTFLFVNELVQALFVTIKGIKTHLLLKSKEKRMRNQTRYHICESCENAFTQAGSLKIHINAVHND